MMPPNLFLYQVTSRKDQQQYWTHKGVPYNYVCIEEFADKFQLFHVGRNLGDELSIEFDKKMGHPAALTNLNYGISKKELFKTCLAREWLLMKRNSVVYIFQITQVSTDEHTSRLN